MVYIKRNEDKIYEFVKSGHLEIDATGAIWRVLRRGWDRWKQTVVARPCRRTRVDRRVNQYQAVSLRINGKQYLTSAHRLVYRHFYGEMPRGMVINHKNGMKHDNRPENLEAVTPSENLKHAYKTGLKHENGEINPHAKLSNEQIVEIRSKYAEGGVTQVVLSREYQVAYQTISDIVRGESRKEQPGITADYTKMRQRTPLERNSLGQYRRLS